MQAGQIHKNIMRLVNLNAQAVDAPFSSGDQIHQEIIGLMNEKLLELGAAEKIANLVQSCDFATYQPWVPGPITAGVSALGTYNGAAVRYLCTRAGLSETEPDGDGEFTMNANELAVPATNVDAAAQYRIGNNIWQPVIPGICGSIFPADGDYDIGATFVDDTGFVWNYVRPVLFWKNMGDPAAYPVREICPNCKIFDNASFFSLSRNRRLQCITPQQWNQKRAMNVIADSVFFMSAGDRYGDNAIWLYPQYAVGEKLTFMYQQKNFIRSADGTFKEQFDSENDELLFPWDIFAEGVAGNWLADKGLSSAARHLAISEKLLDKYLAQNAVAPVVDMRGTRTPESNIREGWWPL